MAADEVKSAGELALLKTIVPPQADVKADDVGHTALRGKFGEGTESGDGVPHADAVKFPGEGIAGAAFGLEMMAIFVFHFSNDRAGRKLRNLWADSGGGSLGRFESAKHLLCIFPVSCSFMRLFRYYSKQLEIVFEMISNLFRPGKKETLLYFEEIGLTLSVPVYLAVLTKKQLSARLKKATKRGDKPATTFATGDNCQTLFMARNAENYHMSGIMIPLEGRRPVDARNEYYEFLHSQLNDLKDRYKQYAKVLVEEQSVNGVIGELPFEKTEIAARVPEEILYNVSYYHGFHKGFQILLCATFSGEKKGIDMLRHIEEARFS